MDNTSLQRFKDALNQNDRVAVVVGKNPSIDEMGAALSLYLSLKASNKAVSIASPSQPIVEHSSLVGIDEVRGTIGTSAGDLVVSFPYQEGEIEKVSYTIENGMLNIVVKAGENGLTFQEQDVKFSRGGGVPSLIITVGVAQLVELGDMLQSDALREVMIVNIDTDPNNEGYGDIVLVSPQYSSLSEYMATLILSNGFPMDVDGAQNLMNGISYATNNFQNPNTSYYAFEIVAELMRRGAVRIQAQQPVQTPSYMQPQPQPQNQQRNQQQRSSGLPRPFGQQRGRDQGQRSHGRPNQQQRHHGSQQQQNQSARQDEIRRALAEQARAMQAAQMQPQNPQGSQQPVSQPMPEPMPQSISQHEQQSTPVDAPADWLTPKVYKGSSDLS